MSCGLADLEYDLRLRGERRELRGRKEVLLAQQLHGSNRRHWGRRQPLC